MAMPSSAITRYDLSAPFSEFDLAANRMGFIGPSVARPVLVGLQAASIGKIKVEELLKAPDTRRAPKGGYGRGQWEFTTFDYACNEYGWEEPLDDANVAMYRDMIDAEGKASQRAIDFVLGGFETAVAAALYNTTTWTGAALTTTITHEWDDSANAVPITDVQAASEIVVTGCGMSPNALICNRAQYFNLCNTAQVLDRVKYTARADQQTMRAAVADCLGIKFIFVANGIKNTAKPGQDVSLSRIWSPEYAMVARVAETNDPKEPCVARTFMWTGDGPGAPGTDEELAVIGEEYREESRRGGVIRERTNYDIVVMYAQCAHLLSNVTTI